MLKIRHYAKPQTVVRHCKENENIKNIDKKMKIKILLFSFVLAVPLNLNAQHLNLYWIWDLEENENKKVGFISFSDSYPLSENSDSLAIPDFYTIEKENREYFKLVKKYRKRFLSKTKISETDSLFIYDYSTNVLLSFSIKNLKVVAYLNNYRNVNNCRPCDQYDYRIGFEINKSLLNGLGNHYQHALVYVGKENPFLQGQIKPIVWKTINPNEFPLKKSNPKTNYRYPNTTRDKTYLYESNEFQYFLQDLVKTNTNEVWERHLLIIDKNNGNLVVERVFQYSEGTRLTPLYLGKPSEDWVIHPKQWTGKFFKNKPNVVFGFESILYGCPRIIFIDSKEEDIWTKCDNRH